MANVQKDMQQNASRFGETAKETASNVASQAKDMAKDIGSSVAHKAGEAASYVGKKADDAASAVGSGIKSLAGSIREAGPDKGMMGTATSAVADTLESSGRYLQKQGLSGIGDDLTGVIRRNPLPAVLLSIGVGYLIARALTPSRS